MKRKGRLYYVGLNLVVPGLGQLAKGSYLSGLLFMVSSLLSAAWAIWLVVQPLYRNIRIMLEGAEEQIAPPDIRKFLFWILILILIWCASMLEILLNVPKPKDDEPAK